MTYAASPATFRCPAAEPVCTEATRPEIRHVAGQIARCHDRPIVRVCKVAAAERVAPGDLLRFHPFAANFGLG
jgi:hypothetical protein